ncbi:MAG: hypothetical protein M3186_11700 [Actinomycetota bacterium]|nr:hypothetical protein [Actinomycetota bacterium]
MGYRSPNGGFVALVPGKHAGHWGTDLWLDESWTAAGDRAPRYLTAVADGRRSLVATSTNWLAA